MENLKQFGELRRDEILRSPELSEFGMGKGDYLAAGDGSRLVQAASSYGDRRGQTVALRLCWFVVCVAGLTMLGCATTHASLQVTAPLTATAGTAFTVTVTAVYEGNRDTVINSVVQFTSSDSAAVLPGLYRFTPADAGFHTWPNGFILKTPGNQTITATMVNEAGINGTATVTVSPSDAAQF
jgi:hypothetical protein